MDTYVFAGDSSQETLKFETSLFTKFLLSTTEVCSLSYAYKHKHKKLTF
jgi:hypothetical protein